ncbi:amino acid/polyamine transporter I [Microdochium bolleyi]|uniref:Amino acid/polyamine transporter I n=1 Tax=Microdochium bolleyi TaxID=196109 RepID=A0A136IQJ4_9PEZI|nr:amino acid/polyamine transporter I [Microdochium bolleyi]
MTDKERREESPHSAAQVASIHAVTGEVLRRDIKPSEILALGFNICNSWIAIATSLAIAISAGGTVTVIYGIIVISFSYSAIGITLAELASVYPTAGGQYHFASILSPYKCNRAISYTCGLAAVASWIFLSAAITILSCQLLLTVPSFYVESYTPEPWHYFLVFQAINAVMLIYNIFCLKKTPWTHNIGFAMSLVMFLVIFVTCLARSTKQPSDAVWTSFNNQTGWPAGITFLTGLVTPASMFGGIDAVLHLAEECNQPQRTVPKALMSILAIGMLTGFAFAVAMSYGITDLDVLVGATMPIFELWRQATNSDLAATLFVVALHVITLFSVNAVQQTASRMAWAFARDGGLPPRHKLAHVDARQLVPVWALCANAAIVLIGGCIYLGYTAAFSAIISSSLVLQLVSFAIPAALLLWHRRSPVVLPADRPFRVKAFIGWSANIFTVVLSIVFAVIFTFPGAIPVTGNSMNYASAVIAAVGILGGLNWIFYARRHYTGPSIDEYRTT